MKNVGIFAVCALLFCSCTASAPSATAQAAVSSPVIGPAVERNGVRFETWLVSPKIVAPDKSVNRKNTAANTLFGLRVTNLTRTPLRINPHCLSLTLIGPNGKESFASPIVIHGYVLQPQEQDYILLLPGQSQTLPNFADFFWRDTHLCLAWPSSINGHPFIYEGARLSDAVNDLLFSPRTGLAAGIYRFSVRYAMPTQAVTLRDDQTDKIVKTLVGFWTGDVSTPPLTFQLAIPTASTPPAQTAPAPIISLPFERSGVRFETWLVSRKIVIPDRSVTYEKQRPATLFSVRITNLTQTPVRFNPFVVRMTLIGPDGEEVNAGFVIGGGLRSPSESDYLLLAPGQSVVLSRPSSFYWHDNSLCLDWPSHLIDHPWSCGGLVAGAYQFEISCSMSNSTMPIYDDCTRKVIKTLNGFWTGEVTMPRQSFQLVTRPN